MDIQVDTIAKSEASRLVHRKALFAVSVLFHLRETRLKCLFQIFKQLTKQLLQGKALSIEDAADALSLKDNIAENKLKDYVTALRLLVNAEVSYKLLCQTSFGCSISLRSPKHGNMLHSGPYGGAFTFTTSTSISTTVLPQLTLFVPSWNQIRQTAGATDDQVTDRFRNTALHAAFMGTLDVSVDHPDGYILLPHDAIPPPTSAEISSRWPGMPTEEVAALLRDYQWESRALEELGLEDVVDRVRELAMEDAARWQ